MNQATSKKPELQNPAASPDISSKREDHNTGSNNQQNDVEFQATMLEGVSRTFALTIPQLPRSLRAVVSNAYLLCRTVDTIEDEPALSPDQKRKLSNYFLEVLETGKKAEELQRELGPLLSDHTIPAEHELIQQLHRVVKITHGFAPAQQNALLRCVRIMSEGMVHFQECASSKGLKDQGEMDKYCYCVAGVVGEMLTELFCYYSKEIAKNQEKLLELSSSFGQGLQMTNILKDIWDDQKRDVCWLPRDIFRKKGMKLNKINALSSSIQYQECIRQLVGLAHAHLENALHYTLLIPKEETGIRKFCLWAIGMAMLTLRKINSNLSFTDSRQVKITRNSVRATVLISNITVKSNMLLKIIFKQLGHGLPKDQF